MAVIGRLQGQFAHRDEAALGRLLELEAHPLPYVPTIGSEIEVTWSSLFPRSAARAFKDGKSWPGFTDEEKDEFDVVCSALDTEMLPLYEAITRAGVPKGKDAYWEFAQSPCASYETLAEETRILMGPGAQAVPLNAALSLHITLGGLAGGSGAAFVHSLTEVAGGTTPSRIRGAIQTGAPATNRQWARKAKQGLRERYSNELIGAEAGVEMRSLVAQNPDQMRSTLRTAQILGALLCGFRAFREGEVNDTTQLFHARWSEVAVVTKAAFSEAGMDINKPWRAPFENAKPWTLFADFIEGTRAPKARERLLGFVAFTVDYTEELLHGNEI